MFTEEESCFKQGCCKQGCCKQSIDSNSIVLSRGQVLVIGLLFSLMVICTLYLKNKDNNNIAYIERYQRMERKLYMERDSLMKLEGSLWEMIRERDSVVKMYNHYLIHKH